MGLTEAKPDPVDGCVDVCVYVCTYRRNEALARLLDSLQVAAKAASSEARLGVVVVDDNPDRAAEPVVAESAAVFPLGLHYRFSGAGNIAIARNTGLEAAMALAPWVAMVDDDQIVVPEWLSELLRVQREYGADAVTAPVYARFEADAPDWIREQPFAELWCTPPKDDGASVTDLQTANSLISTEFLQANPEVRFAADLGEAGGEDMVFYRMALDAGLKAHYSHHAVNWEIEPPERATYRYQLRRNLWHGNTEAITNLRAGRDSRIRLMARAAKRAAIAGGHPFRQRRAGDPPEWRYAFAYSLQSVGMILGAAGVVLRHG